MEPFIPEGLKRNPRRRILVVNDDLDVTEILVRTLEESGFAAWAVNHPLEEASRRAIEIAPDLVIVDFDMPKLLGSELSMLLKRDPGLRDVPILFLSGMADADHRLIAHLSGAAAYLEKPIDPVKLVQKIRELLA